MKVHDRSSSKPRHSAAEIRRAVADYQHGDATQGELARRYGVCAGTIRNWLRRSGGQDDAKIPAFVELLPVSHGSRLPYRIELSNGRSLVLPPDWDAVRVRELIFVASDV
ncbi:MAG: helix-turn-helix domain-containing protein [Verrucomicrobiales bacterium]|nr:helix-turn-helix domain-containing protein [Verrucomicrobiales bacterium]